MKKTVIAIVGPTAVGKTKLSIEIAKRFNGEIISGDSMQVYKDMDIGTAKVTETEMEGIPHYMIDLKEPNENFSVADFQSHVQSYIDKIDASDKLPIIVGGSGLYIQATLYNYDFSKQTKDEAIVARLEKELVDNGIEPLYQRLKKVDPAQADVIHPNNHRRVIRALEIYEITGKPMSDSQNEQYDESPYNVIFIGLEMERKELYERINQRVDLMIDSGLVEEVQRLYEAGFEGSQAMKAIGYKEFIPYFKGKETLESTIDLLKRNSRRYAKRQYTWFKNKLDVNWYMIESSRDNLKFTQIFSDLERFLKE